MPAGLGPRDYPLLIIAWASISVSSILVLLSGATALQAAFWRVLLGSMITMALARRPPAPGALARPLHVAAGALLGAHFLTWMESLFHIPVALSTTLVVLYPLFLLLFDKAVMREPLGARQALGTLLAFLGVAAMTTPGLNPVTGGEWALGALLALTGALAAAGYFALGRLARTGGTPLAEYTTSVYLWASAALLTYALATHSPLIPPTPRAWPYLLLLAIIPMLGGHSLMNYLLKKTPTSTATSIALGEPAGATLLAWLLLDQHPPPQTLAGMAITLTGITTALAPTKKI